MITMSTITAMESTTRNAEQLNRRNKKEKLSLDTNDDEDGRPAKKAKLLDGSDDSSSESESSSDEQLRINEEYARRFEHNKKREERHRLEEKYGKEVSIPKRGRNGAEHVASEHSDDDSSSDETEDEGGFLATMAADVEFAATLKALKEKDPKIYDKTAQFYTPANEDEDEDEGRGPEGSSLKKEKPMTLRDYHRKNLLEGNIEAAESEEPVQTYAEEQESLKRNIVAQMHAAAEIGEVEGEDEDQDSFLVRKSILRAEPTRPVQLSEADIAAADKDPEAFLSNFLAARAWIPEGESRFQPMESDDSEDDERADAFEEAYNMRFENPALSNVNIISHSRSAVTKYSVRREEANPRKRARDKEREKKQDEKSERDKEKARLRKLRTEEVELKVVKIKEAAGLRGKNTDILEWSEILEKEWDDNRWNQEFEKRFGDAYYGNPEEGSDSDDKVSKKKKVKKPKWDDDIHIKDLVPDFVEDENPPSNLSDEEMNDISAAVVTEEMEDLGVSNTKSKKERLSERAEKKKASRRDRRLIEQLVENTLPTDAELAATQKSKSHVPFRYRETSPTSFGLTALDILTASDAQLNSYMGLKKITPFRDPERKEKERKKISKKGRLREWRKEVHDSPGDARSEQQPNVSEKIKDKANDEGKKKRKKKSKNAKSDGEAMVA